MRAALADRAELDEERAGAVHDDRHDRDLNDLARHAERQDEQDRGERGQRCDIEDRAARTDAGKEAVEVAGEHAPGPDHRAYREQGDDIFRGLAEAEPVHRHADIVGGHERADHRLRQRLEETAERDPHHQQPRRRRAVRAAAGEHEHDEREEDGRGRAGALPQRRQRVIARPAVVM